MQSVKKTFVTPTQKEVEDYMKEKKGWPSKFCEYYGERFWNFYQSNGWKVSARAAMKDWKAAFNSQWQTLKFKEDIEFMKNCEKDGPPTGAPQDENSNYVENVMLTYISRPTQVPVERLAGCYDWMKEKHLLLVEKSEWKTLKETYSHDIMRGKAAAVGISFEKMYRRNVTITQLMKNVQSVQ